MANWRIIAERSGGVPVYRSGGGSGGGAETEKAVELSPLALVARFDCEEVEGGGCRRLVKSLSFLLSWEDFVVKKVGGSGRLAAKRAVYMPTG